MTTLKTTLTLAAIVVVAGWAFGPSLLTGMVVALALATVLVNRK